MRRNGARHRFTDLGPSESCAERREPITGNRQYAVDRRFEPEFPVSPVGLQAKEPDVSDVDGVLAVNPDETIGLEQRRDLTNRSDIDERGARSKANLGFPSPCTKTVDVTGVKHALLAA